MAENIITEKEYPQYTSSDIKVQSSIQIQKPDIHDFKNKNGALHNRPISVFSYKETEFGVLLECCVSARKCAYVNTHETAMFQYQDTSPTIERIYLAIDIWDENIIRVRFYADIFKDHYALLPEDAKMLTGKPKQTNYKLLVSDEYLTIETAALKLYISRSNAEIRIVDINGKTVYSQYRSGFFTADVFDTSVSKYCDETACFESLKLDYDEEIFGLGERFDSVTRRGRAVDFRNKDAIGTTSPRTYVNTPFYISTKGYGLFLNSSAPAEWDIGCSDASTLGFGVLDGQMDYFIIQGETPKAVISGYCTLTGFSGLPPLWSFGLWMSRNSYTSWDVVFDIARKIRENDIPCDVIHLDTAWFAQDWNCDLKFSEERFPNPRENMEELRKDGFKISLWQYNFIPPRDNNEHYREAVECGYLAKNAEGKPYTLSSELVGSWLDDVIVDFSNPDARNWYATKIKALIQMGAGAIKTDFGEGIPDDAYYYGIDGKHFHNLYSLIYNYTVAGATKEASGEDIVWARSGTAGSQRFPLHWGGDSQCTFEALAGTLRAALSIGMSGIPFFSHDIGGFIGLPTDELYMRWAQLGLFSSHSRCHGAGDFTHREPWMFGDEACAIFRDWAKLRYSLMPYIYSEAKKCTETGLPMMRALYLEYSDDRNTYNIDHEYMFGDSILVAPVLKPLSESTIREVYLPRGIWFDYFTREKIESTGQWIKREVTLSVMPIYIKEGTVLEYSAEGTTLQNGYGDIVKKELWI